MTKKKEYKDFESAIVRIEEIVASLESGRLSLEESIGLYTEGIEIAGICNQKLTDAEGQIARLSKVAEKFRLDKLSEENADE
jgi:exodeoxyribonuclease VII small subunit